MIWFIWLQYYKVVWKLISVFEILFWCGGNMFLRKERDNNIIAGQDEVTEFKWISVWSHWTICVDIR